MRALIFQIGNDRYGLRTRDIAQVLPMVTLKRLPHAPAYVAGLLNHHGTTVPVIDLNQLGGGTACRERFDSRLIVVHYRAGNGNEGDAKHLLGLLAERVTGTQDLRQESFGESGVSNVDAPYLGAVAADHGRGILQIIEIAHILPAAVRAQLYQSAEPVVHE